MPSTISDPIIPTSLRLSALNESALKNFSVVDTGTAILGDDRDVYVWMKVQFNGSNKARDIDVPQELVRTLDDVTVSADGRIEASARIASGLDLRAPALRVEDMDEAEYDKLADADAASLSNEELRAINRQHESDFHEYTGTEEGFAEFIFYRDLAIEDEIAEQYADTLYAVREARAHRNRMDDKEVSDSLRKSIRVAYGHRAAAQSADRTALTQPRYFEEYCQYHNTVPADARTIAFQFRDLTCHGYLAVTTVYLCGAVTGEIQMPRQARSTLICNVGTFPFEIDLPIAGEADF